MMRKKDSKMSLFSYKSNLLSFITDAFFSQKTHKGLRMMLRTTTMKRQHVLLNEMILLRSEKVFFLLSLCLSLLNCVLQQNSSSFYEVLYKIWDHFWKKKRKERKHFGEDTHHTSVQNGALCPYKKFLAKEDHKKPTLVTEFLKPTETLLLSSRLQKKQKPLLLTRAQKNVASPGGGKSLWVL